MYVPAGNQKGLGTHMLLQPFLLASLALQTSLDPYQMLLLIFGKSNDS